MARRAIVAAAVFLLGSGWAVLVGRPGELEGFDPDRFVYRLDPRAD